VGNIITPERKLKIISYTPHAKQAEAHKLCRLDDADAVMYSGAPGSAKTTWLCWEVLWNCFKYPGSKWAICRKTFRELEDTTKETLRVDVLNKYNIPYNEKKEENIFELPGGSKLLFRSLDELDKFGSLEITGFAFDEAQETQQKFCDTLLDRRRFNIGHPLALFAANSPSKDHWLYDLFINPETRREGYYYVIASIYDNKVNLPEIYIKNMEKAYKDLPALARQKLHGEFGVALRGTPIYKRSFRREIHVKSTVGYNKFTPVLRSWDFGFVHPAVVYAQDIDGKCHTLKVTMEKEINLDMFAKKIIKESGKLFPENAGFIDYCDPAGAQRSDKGESSISILKKNGIRAKFKYTSVSYGISLTETMLNTLRDGTPCLLFSDEDCELLIEGFELGYVYDQEEIQKGDDDLSPKKDGYYEHPMDALRYLLINHFDRYYKNKQGKKNGGRKHKAKIPYYNYMQKNRGCK
jgi:hypothetical protein